MSLEADLRRLAAQLVEVETLAAEGPEKLGRRAPRVSGWSVAEQLDHLTKVLERALDRLAERPPALDRGINLTGRILLAVGRLPRGVGKSPAAVRGSDASGEELVAAVARIRGKLAALGAAAGLLSAPEPVLPHPYFGCLDAAQAVRFLAVHTDHHLRIVADIRRATGA